MSEQLAVIVMLRNEADILPALIAHVSTLFDRAIVIDHTSTDGSREMLEGARAEWPWLEIFDYGIQGYYQGALSTAFARKAFEEGADWVFFLDADEFVDVPDRAALQGVLPADGAAVLSFGWRNCAPTVFGSYEFFDFDQEFLVRQTPSRYSKVVLSRRILQQFPSFRLTLGNHVVLPTPEASALQACNIGEYLHIPIRSHERLAMKLEAGVAAYRAKSRKPFIEGYHWFELLERLHAGAVDDDFLRSVALDYGEMLSRMATLSSCCTHRLRIAPAGVTKDSVHTRDATRFARSRGETRKLDRRLVWRQLRAENENVAVLIGEGNQVYLRPQVMLPDGEAVQDIFASLPSDDALPANNFAEQRLAAALEMAFTPVETLIAGAWSRMVPAMLGLVALLRPRRFVELGSDRGCSFFAACQAMNALNLEAEAIAIDTWRGDPEAGSEAGFVEFNYILRRHYQARSYFIRSESADAAACFEDGSIDLLHIDGLQCYDAARTVFEIWLAKMSNRGVVMLHNTIVHECGYGVWRFWREITVRYPSVNLLHGHGLGVVYVGNQEGCLAGTLRELASDPTRCFLLNEFICNLGRLSFRAATSAQAAATSAQAAATSAQAAVTSAQVAARSATEAAAELAAARAEVAVRQAELAATQAELVAIRASTSWRLSAPVRLLGRVLHGGTRD